MTCRENCSLWIWLKLNPKWLILGYDKYTKKWGLPYIFKLIKKPYFLHDTFGRYFNKYIKCKLFGHKNVKLIEKCIDNKKVYYCFDCEQEINKI